MAEFSLCSVLGGWRTKAALPMRSLTCMNCAALPKQRSSLQGGSVPACRWLHQIPPFFKQQLKQWGFIAVSHTWSWSWFPQWELSQPVALWEDLLVAEMDNKTFDPWKIRADVPMQPDTAFACWAQSWPTQTLPVLSSHCYLILSFSRIFLQASPACFGFFPFFPCLHIALNNSSSPTSVF